jgi:hypothetical protein
MAELTPLKEGQCVRGTCFGRKVGKRDESGIPAAQLIAFLNTLPDLPNRRVLSERSGVVSSMLYRILGGEQQVVSLGVADRLLMAVGQDVCALTYEGTLAVVPYASKADAITMAVYENLDDDDKLTVAWDIIEARAAELLAEREALIA